MMAGSPQPGPGTPTIYPPSWLLAAFYSGKLSQSGFTFVKVQVDSVDSWFTNKVLIMQRTSDLTYWGCQFRMALTNAQVNSFPWVNADTAKAYSMAVGTPLYTYN